MIHLVVGGDRLQGQFPLCHFQEFSCPNDLTAVINLSRLNGLFCNPFTSGNSPIGSAPALKAHDISSTYSQKQASK